MLFLLLLGVAAGYLLQRIAYAKCWYRRLRVRAEFSDAYAYEGDTAFLQEEIINDKLLPLPALEVWLSLSRNLVFSDEARQNASISDMTYRRDVFSLLFYQRIVRKLSFVCQKRGFYQLGKVELLGYDLLFSSKYHLELPQRTQLYVYPAQVDDRRIRLLCRAISGTVLTQSRLYPDPFEFSGIREYRSTDPMNQINWKASAKNGSLMVNQFDSTTNLKLTLFLDVEDTNILRQEELTEEGIRIAASLAVRLAKANMELQLLSNAVYEEWGGAQMRREKLYWNLKTGERRIQELNRKLACIDSAATEEGIAKVLHREVQKQSSGNIYVLISKNQEPAVMEKLHLLAANGNEVLWVLLLQPNQERTMVSAPQIRVLPWEVRK